MGEWKEYKISDIVILVKDSWKVGDEKLPYLGLEHIDEAKLRLNNIGSSDDVASNKYRFNSGDVLFGKLRPYFRKVVKPNFNGICSTDMWVLNSTEKSDINFIFYFFANQELIDLSYSSSSGTRMPRADWKFLSQTLWDIPALEEQKAIAGVLSSLDDKIDLLHRQNKTIEEMAQTLFRQWFIEEAKDEWEEYEIRDFATHKKVSIKPAKNPNDIFLHFSLPAFDTNKEPLQELGSDIKSNKYQVEPYSILMSKLNPKTPRVWDIYFEPEENSICSTEFQVVQPNDKELFPFISTLLKSNKVRGDLSMSTSGTSGSHQRVKPEDIFNITFLTPSVDKLKEFSYILEPNYLKQRKNQQQIKTLENTRDTLLPKLMSGEVRIRLNGEKT